MNIPKDVKDALGKDYELIPLDQITDEARVIAVLWMEEDDRTFIANKHKLASDIMNYAKRYHSQQVEVLLLEHLKQLNTLAKQAMVVKEQYEKQLAFKDEEIKMLKHLNHKQ